MAQQCIVVFAVQIRSSPFCRLCLVLGCVQAGARLSMLLLLRLQSRPQVLHGLLSLCQLPCSGAQQLFGSAAAVLVGAVPIKGQTAGATGSRGAGRIRRRFASHLPGWSLPT